jgi:hypothetical protein
MDLNAITLELRDSQLPPGKLSEYLVQLAGEYAFISSRLEEILKVKPQVWLKLREESKSDTQADKKWESSQDGLQEIIYKLQLKSIEKQLSSIKTRLHIYEMEARNQF